MSRKLCLNEITILDGGMGQELLARSRYEPHPMWSAFVLSEEPEIVREVHLDYLRAGARVLTINAYSVTPIRLKRNGASDRFEELQQRACRIAIEARDAFLSERPDVARDHVKIAGCMPPLANSYMVDGTPEPEAALADY